ncbi:MAG: hypothetical protein CNCCGFBP_00344 [Fimbriimonadaceae bacterium]|nr:hypothetical protein [Fimbriimonadaceae bacterium]
MSKAIKAKVDPSKIILEGISILRAAMDPSDAYIAAPMAPATTAWHCSTAWNIDHGTGNVVLTMRIDLQGMDKKGQEIGLRGYYELGYRFKILNLKQLTWQVDGKDAVDGQLLATIVGLAYSTTRGIVMERTYGTFFNGVILPVLDPKLLLQDIPVVPTQQE